MEEEANQNDERITFLKRYVEKNYTYRYGRVFASVEERDHPELVGHPLVIARHPSDTGAKEW